MFPTCSLVSQYLLAMNQQLDATTCPLLLDRIATLAPESGAQWGTMDVAQMLAHCQIPLELASRERTMKRGLVGLLFGRIALRSVLKEKPFGQNAPTAPSFRVTDKRELAKERERLVGLMTMYVERGPEGLPSKHPFFGPMTPAQWSVLQWKHLDHHLRQFGA